MSTKTAQKQPSSSSVRIGADQPISPSFQFVNYAGLNPVMSEPQNLVLDASVTPVNDYKSAKVPSTRDSSNSQPALSNTTLVPNAHVVDTAFIDKNYLFDNGAILGHPDGSGYSQPALSPTSTRQNAAGNVPVGLNGNITPVAGIVSSSSGVDLSASSVPPVNMMSTATSVPLNVASGGNMSQASNPDIMADIFSMFSQDDSAGIAGSIENGVNNDNNNSNAVDSLTLPTMVGDANNSSNGNSSTRGPSPGAASGNGNDFTGDLHEQRGSVGHVYDELNSLDNLLDGFVSPHMDPLVHTISNTSIPMASIDENVFSVDRRASAVVSGLGAIPMRSAAKNSISHALDAWNIANPGVPAVSNKVPRNSVIDTNVAQTLNGYSMNFGLPGAQATVNNITLNGGISAVSGNRNERSPDADTTVPEVKESSDCRSPGQGSPSTMHMFSTQQSRSFLDASSQKALGTEQIPNDLFASLYTPLDFFSTEPCVTPLEETTTKVNGNTPKGASVTPEFDESATKSSPKTKFIKPSMILADSSKLGYMGGAKRSSVSFPSIDTQVYHPTARVSKRKSISSSSTINSKSDPYGRRRRSVIGLADTLPLSGSSSTSLNVTPLSATPVLPTGSNGTASTTTSSTPVPVSRSATSSALDDKSAKQFQCSECDKAFRRSEHLKRHIRSVHSSERPFHCVLCEKKFSRSDNLSQHLKTHRRHGDF